MNRQADGGHRHGAAARHRLAALFAAVCLLPATLAVTAAAQAENATGRVLVSIVGNASAVTAVTNLQVGLSDAAPEATTGTSGTDITGDAAGAGAPPPAVGGAGLPTATFDLGSESSLPGSFAVVGEAGQVFSVQLPDQVVLDLDGELVQLSGFQHDGGITPSARDDGILEVRFSADIDRDQASALQNLVPASGTVIDDREIVILQVSPPQEGDGPADGNQATVTSPNADGAEGAQGGPAAGTTRIAVRVADPFNLPKNDNQQVVIIISFN